MSKTYPPELQEFVQHELATGPFHSEDELLVAALTVYRDLKQRHEELRRDVQLSLEQAERGEVGPLDIDAIKSELTHELGENGQPR